MPFGNQSSGFTNSAAQSTVIHTVAAPSSPTSVELKIPSIFTPVDQTVVLPGPLSILLAPELANTFLAGPASLIPGTGVDEISLASVSTVSPLVNAFTTTEANELLIVATSTDSYRSSIAGTTGASLTYPIGGSGPPAGYAFGYQTGVAAGAQSLSTTYTNTSGQGSGMAQVAVSFITSGGTPVVVGVGSGTSGNINDGITFSGGAIVSGQSIIFWYVGGFTSSGAYLGSPPVAPTDSQGNAYVLLGYEVVSTTDSAFPGVVTGIFTSLWLCQNPAAAGSMAYTTHTANPSAYGFGGLATAFTVTNLGTVSGIPTFRKLMQDDLPIGVVNNQTMDYTAQESDGGQLITFNSSTARTLTLPTAPPSSNFSIDVENQGSANLTISPASGATIDGANSSFVLYPNNGVRIFGVAPSYYFTQRGINGYDVTVFNPGVGSNAQTLLRIPVTRKVLFPASAGNSYASAGTAAATSTTYTLKQNGSSFCTVNWAMSATSGTFTQAADATFAPGDILEVDGPATADASLANFSIALFGVKI